MTKSKSASPTLLASNENWVGYFEKMNTEQIQILQKRLERIYIISQNVLQRREEQKALLWELLK